MFIDNFKNRKINVECKTKDEVYMFFEYLDEQEVTWNSGHKILEWLKSIPSSGTFCMGKYGLCNGGDWERPTLRFSLELVYGDVAFQNIQNDLLMELLEG